MSDGSGCWLRGGWGAVRWVVGLSMAGVGENGGNQCSKVDMVLHK